MWMHRDQYTLMQILDALKGSSATKILNSELASLPLYNRGSNILKYDLERLLHMLVIKDILAESLMIGNHDNVICYVKPGSNAWNVLNGQITGIILQTRTQKKKVFSSGAASTAKTEEMMQINGVTEAKWKNCQCEEFLKLTSEYASKVEEASARTNTASAVSKSPYFEGGKENMHSSGWKGKRKKTTIAPQPKKQAKLTITSGDTV